VPHFLENSDLPLGLIFGRDGDLAKAAFLGEPLYDLDGDVVTCFETTGQLDFAMYPSAYLIDDFVLIYKLATSDEVLLNLCLMRPRIELASYRD
jgi:hypothetical protein